MTFYMNIWVFTCICIIYLICVIYIVCCRIVAILHLAIPILGFAFPISLRYTFLLHDLSRNSLPFVGMLHKKILKMESRHYNAWYGLGMLYLHQEKFEFSEHHFRMAFRINPKSSVILSYIGTALHFLKVNLLLHLLVFLYPRFWNYTILWFLIEARKVWPWWRKLF